MNVLSDGHSEFSKEQAEFVLNPARVPAGMALQDITRFDVNSQGNASTQNMR